MFDLSGRLAVVTGARRGIGLAFAEALAAAGADIAGVSASLETDTSEAQQRVEALGRTFYPFPADLSDPGAVRELPARIAGARASRRHPGQQRGNDPSRAGGRALRRRLGCRARGEPRRAVPARSRHRRRDARAPARGKIIFTASMLSYQGGITVPGYTASKSAVAGLTKALANEWAPGGVNVNAIAPGYIATDNTQALRDDRERSQAILDRIPAGRWGRPADLAGAIVFLASAASDYVHGTTLAVDGGWLAR